MFRLVKFESTKSLASTSSRSLGGALSENGDREAALQSVLTFIAEQQKYVHAKESRPCSIDDITKEFNIEAPPQHIEDLKNCECENELFGNKTEFKATNGEDENYVTLKQLCTEFNLNEQNVAIKVEKVQEDVKMREETIPGIAYAEEVCMVTPIDIESENCSNISEHPVDICSSVNVELTSTDYQQGILSEKNFADNLSSRSTTMSESLTSSISTPDTVVSKIPRRKNFPSKIPISPAKSKNQPETSKIPKSKIPFRSKISQKQKMIQIPTSHAHPVISTEKLPQCTSGILSNIIDGPPNRAVSFHERATSKDVIDELNRMIKNGDENVSQSQESNSEITSAPLDEACKSTGWIHVEKDVDLGDPTASLWFHNF